MCGGVQAVRRMEAAHPPHHEAGELNHDTPVHIGGRAACRTRDPSGGSADDAARHVEEGWREHDAARYVEKGGSDGHHVARLHCRADDEVDR